MHIAAMAGLMLSAGDITAIQPAHSICHHRLGNSRLRAYL